MKCCEYDYFVFTVFENELIFATRNTQRWWISVGSERIRPGGVAWRATEVSLVSIFLDTWHGASVMTTLWL